MNTTGRRPPNVICINNRRRIPLDSRQTNKNLLVNVQIKSSVDVISITCHYCSLSIELPYYISLSDCDNILGPIVDWTKLTQSQTYGYIYLLVGDWYVFVIINKPHCTRVETNNESVKKWWISREYLPDIDWIGSRKRTISTDIETLALIWLLTMRMWSFVMETRRETCLHMRSTIGGPL